MRLKLGAVLKGPTSVGPLGAICAAAVALAFATPAAVRASTVGPTTTAIESMKVLDGVWVCRQHIGSGTRGKSTISIAPTNEKSWFHGSLQESPNGYGTPWYEELYWSYSLARHEWMMFVFAGHQSGEFSGDWWQGNTFTWHGSMEDMLVGHIYHREIVWVRQGGSRLDWNEYDMFADGSRLIDSSDVCTKSRH